MSTEEISQNILRIHLNNGRQVLVFEAGVADVLERLGLDEYLEDWKLNLESDIG